jgi:subtilisin-like proprotein convertase family protein
MKIAKYILMIANLALLLHSDVMSQCLNCTSQFPSTLQTINCGVTNQVISTCMFGGEWAACDVVLGSVYTWTTCGDFDFDTELTLRSGSCTGALLAYSDDACGAQSTINWTATFTGTVYVLVSRFLCSNQSSCMTLLWSRTCGPPPSSIITTCSGTFYDTGGAGGNYSANENITWTYCPSVPGAKVSMNFTLFDIENSWDFLTIYDGNSIAAPTLGTYTGAIGPGVVTATPGNASGCLTFVFTSDGIINYQGWAANISCTLPCQLINSVFLSSNPAPQANGIIQICQGQTVTFNGIGTFSDNATGASYLWSFGNGATAAGTTASYTFSNAGGYTVNLNITDPLGCTNTNTLNIPVQVSTTPTIATSVNPTIICQGETAVLNAVVTMTPYIQNCTPPVSGTTFLPDGTGVSYQTAITVNCFASNQTVQSASDITNVCLNMEHSYLGDLDITLICPNGQSAILKVYPSSANTYLGCPLDDPTPGPGVGSQYCFTPSAGTLLVNGLTTICGNPPGNSIVAGNYMPVEPFTNFIGCPLNGQWTIQVTDNLGQDNGYIFNWDLNFNPVLQPTSTSFTPTIASQSWLPAAGLTNVNSTQANVVSNTLGSNCYTYSVTDNFGCTYTQTQCVTVTNGVVPLFDPVLPFCEGASAPILPTTSNNGITGIWSPLPVDNLVSNTYTFTPNPGQCAATVTLNVTVIPTSALSPVFHD